MSRFTIVAIAIIAACVVHGVTAEKDIVDEIKDMDVFKIKSSSLACPVPIVGQSCPEANPLFYFKCCGELNSSCCFRLQDWLMVLLVVLAVLVVISLVINFIRCLFCY